VPTLTVISGPNGSGKSTLARSVDFEGGDRLLDPDTIAISLNPLHAQNVVQVRAERFFDAQGHFRRQRGIVVQKIGEREADPPGSIPRI